MEQKSIQTAYGKRLALARQVRGVTQHQLSKMTGVSQPTIGSTEAQGRGSLKTAEFAKALNIDAYWLATGEGEMLVSSAWPFQTFTARDISTIPTEARVYIEQTVTNLLIYLLSGQTVTPVDVSPLVVPKTRNVVSNVSGSFGDLNETAVVATLSNAPAKQTVKRSA
jgi:DNA-binding XRE family transcriptional regulator